MKLSKLKPKNNFRSQGRMACLATVDKALPIWKRKYIDWLKNYWRKISVSKLSPKTS